jgi:hypothetical protein
MTSQLYNYVQQLSMSCIICIDEKMNILAIVKIMDF